MKKQLASLFFLIFFLGNCFAIENKQSKKEPLNITSDKVEIFRNKNIMIFTKNVKAIQSNFTLYADKMIVNYTENENKKINIKTITTEKNVKFITDKIIATGNNGFYDLVNNKIILKNDVRAIEEGIEVTAQEFEYDISTGKTKIIGNQQKGGRVTVTLDNLKNIK